MEKAPCSICNLAQQDLHSMSNPSSYQIFSRLDWRICYQTDVIAWIFKAWYVLTVMWMLFAQSTDQLPSGLSWKGENFLTTYTMIQSRQGWWCRWECGFCKSSHWNLLLLCDLTSRSTRKIHRDVQLRSWTASLSVRDSSLCASFGSSNSSGNSFMTLKVSKPSMLSEVSLWWLCLGAFTHMISFLRPNTCQGPL